MSRFRARGYLLVTDVRVTENLSRALTEYTDDDANYPRWARYWDVERLIANLQKHPQLVGAFFTLAEGSEESRELGKRARQLARVPGKEAEAVTLGVQAVAPAMLAGGTAGAEELTALFDSLPAVERCDLIANHAAYSVASQLICIAGGKEIQTAEAASLKLLARTTINTEWGISNLAISPDGETVAATGRQNAFALWHPNATERPKIMPVGARIYGAPSFSPDSKLFFINHSAGEIRDANSGDIAAVLQSDKETDPSNGVFSPDGRTLITGSSKIACAWDVQTGKLITRLDVHQPIGMFLVSFSPDGRFMLTGGTDGRLVIWDAATWTALRFVHHNSDRSAHAGAISPDGLTVVVATTTGLLFRDIESNEVRLRIELPSRIDAVVFSPDGLRLGCCHHDAHTFSIVDVVTTDVMLTIGGLQGEYFNAEFSPCGQRVLIDDDEGVKLFAIGARLLLARAGLFLRERGSSAADDLLAKLAIDQVSP